MLSEVFCALDMFATIVSWFDPDRHIVCIHGMMPVCELGLTTACASKVSPLMTLSSPSLLCCRPYARPCSNKLTKCRSGAQAIMRAACRALSC